MSELMESLISMPKVLKGIDVRAALTNGKVEIALKTFLGIAWVGTGMNRTYLMDKKFGSKARLDLLAIQDGNARFWIEAKCDFAADRQAVERSAQCAIGQVRTYSGALPDALSSCACFIVHFLCELPEEDDYPGWITAFNPLRGRVPYTSQQLADYYRGWINKLGLQWTVAETVVRFAPEIRAIVVGASPVIVRAKAPAKQSSDNNTATPYSIEEHRHRFACWAASRAASVKGCRFSVAQGRVILEAVLQEVGWDPKNLPQLGDFDEEHAQWRREIISTAKAVPLPFTDGIAAKLINVYLKSMFICGGYEDHERVGALHPPIDAVLLEALEKKEFGGAELARYWRTVRKTPWSRLDSDGYEKVIQNLRQASGCSVHLWKVEEYWRGYQSNDPFAIV